MSEFIARMIMEQYDTGKENGILKYKAYFVNTTLYLKWKNSVDNILKEKGYEEVIESK